LVSRLAAKSWRPAPEAQLARGRRRRPVASGRCTRLRGRGLFGYGISARTRWATRHRWRSRDRRGRRRRGALADLIPTPEQTPGSRRTCAPLPRAQPARPHAGHGRLPALPALTPGMLGSPRGAKDRGDLLQRPLGQHRAGPQPQLTIQDVHGLIHQLPSLRRQLDLATSAGRSDGRGTGSARPPRCGRLRCCWCRRP
jgi:hypothetical protein